jgi:hypothetical protein
MQISGSFASELLTKLKSGCWPRGLPKAAVKVQAGSAAKCTQWLLAGLFLTSCQTEGLSTLLFVT